MTNNPSNKASRPSGDYPSRGLIVRPYTISVHGFPDNRFVAKSRGTALAKAWDQYRCYIEDVSFGAFLRVARVVQRTEPGFGEPVTIAGQPAFVVGEGAGQYVSFVRPGEDVILYSHPLDVARDSDRSPKGGDAERGSVHEGAGLKGIAQ